MSRVDDDRDAARTAARLAEAKRTQENQKSKKAAENNAFSKLVQGQKQEGQVKEQQNLAKSAIAQMLEAAEVGKAEEGKHLEQGAQGAQQESAFKSKLSFKGQEQKVAQNTRSDGKQMEQVKEQGGQESAQTANSRQADQSGSAKAAQGRSSDAKVSRERLEERKEAGEASSSNASSGTSGAGGARGEKGDIKTDADKGGGQQGSGKDDKGGGAAAANPGFRFNPALMAPMSVAKQKEASGSERLRKVANEVAQKIVEKVRIGTNAMGKTEFQIDLKGDVLSGMSVKVSAKNGKISAVFSGSDKDVLKLIEEQGEALRAALGARGLTLEDFKTENTG